MMHFGISRADLKGWLILASITGKEWKLATAAKNGDVPEEERHRLVRADSAKVNLVPASTSAQWFRLVSVQIGNATHEYPNGDSLRVSCRFPGRL